MKRLVEYPLEAGGSVVVEVEVGDDESGGIVPATRPGEVVARASHTLQEALDRIKPAAEVVISKLRELSEQPREVEICFGIKLGAEAGALIAAASAEANYTVTVKWVREGT